MLNLLQIDINSTKDKTLYSVPKSNLFPPWTVLTDSLSYWLIFTLQVSMDGIGWKDTWEGYEEEHMAVSRRLGDDIHVRSDGRDHGPSYFYLCFGLTYLWLTLLFTTLPCLYSNFSENKTNFWTTIYLRPTSWMRNKTFLYGSHYSPPYSESEPKSKMYMDKHAFCLDSWVS